MRRSSGRLALRGLAGLLALFLGLPVAVLIARAALGGALGTGLSAAVVLDALQLSLATTAASLLLTVAIGLPIAGRRLTNQPLSTTEPPRSRWWP